MVCFIKTEGERWHELFMYMLGLFQSVAPPVSWKPSLPKNAKFEDTFDAWRAIEAKHIDLIHAAAHELATTQRLETKSPEVHYFLYHRISDILDGLRITFTTCDERPVSIIPFPDATIGKVAEWYLTEWADWHSAGRLIREEDFR